MKAPEIVITQSEKDEALRRIRNQLAERRGLTAADVRAELERLERDADAIRIDGAFSREDSRRLDDIDARRNEIWDRLVNEPLKGAT